MTVKKKLCFAVAAGLSLTALAEVRAQTIYSDNFERPALSGGTYAYTTTAYTTPTGGTTDSAANIVSTATPTGSYLNITNDSSGAANAVGAAMVSTETKFFNGSTTGTYDFTLNSNQYTGKLVEWRFNLQNPRANPSGFGDGNIGTAFVLGATTSDFFLTGNGYAVTRGAGSDSYNLVAYTGGIKTIGTTSSNSPPSIIATLDPGVNYSSIKVTYDPSNSSWSIAGRDDGATQFNDANSDAVAYTPGGTGVINTTYTGVNLAYMGALYKHASAVNNLTKWDNFSINVNNQAVAGTPRNLTWDSDATGAATDGGGTWITPSSWINAADNQHVNWDSTRPDNATFGAGSGAGAASVDVGTAQSVGRLTFAASSPTYTLNNGTITVTGYDHDADVLTANEGLLASQSAIINSNMNWTGTSQLRVNGAGTVLTLNGSLQGGGHINKFGSGMLELKSTGAARSGTMDIETGTVRVTTVATGVSGFGTGQVDIHSSGTLWLDAGVGAYSLTSNSGTFALGDLGTLKVTGSVTWQKNFPMFTNGTQAVPKNSTIHVDAGGTLLFKAQLRNTGSTIVNDAGTGGAYHTIHVDGPGTLKITNSGSNAGGDSTIFGGSWDISDGKVVLGQNSETGGSSGDTLNALGLKDGDSRQGNEVTVRGTGILVGTEDTANGGFFNAYKNDVRMSGGSLASGNGKNSNWGGHFTTVTGTTSKILTYDPLDGITVRNVNLMAGTAGLQNNQGNTTWNGNLEVNPGATTGGKFIINRDGGTVAVTPGVTLSVLAGAGVDLTGSLDALSDTTNHVNVANSGAFHVMSGTKNVGAISDALAMTGTTTVDASVTVNANSINQGTLNVADGGKAVVRNRAAVGGKKINRFNNLNLNSTGTLDLNDHDLVVNNGNFVVINTQVFDGYSASPDTTKTGIISSAGQAAAGVTILSLFDNASLAASNYPFDSVDPSTTIGANAIVGKYTYIGDADWDGQVTPADYTAVDSNLGTMNVDPGVAWFYGDTDFDYNITPADYTGIDSSLGLGIGNPLSAQGLAAVPEPASLSLLGVGAVGLLARRRRNA